MGRKFKQGTGFAWVLEQCEEIVFIAKYEEAKGRIFPQNSIVSLDQHFYGIGDNLLQRDVDIINIVFRRESKPLIQFRETMVSAYNVPSIKSEHAGFRRKTRDQLASSDDRSRAKLVAFAQEEINQLAAPRFTHDEYTAMHPKFDETLSYLERQRRWTAFTTQARQPQPIVKPTAPPTPAVQPLETDTALRMLRISAANSETRNRILARITNDQALSLAEEIDDPGLQEILLLHVLDA